jgi:hypothetical protein
MYRQFKVDRGRKDHWAPYACPERIRVVYETEDGEVVEVGKKERPPAGEVRGTVAVRTAPRVLSTTEPREGRPVRVDSFLAKIPGTLRGNERLGLGPTLVDPLSPELEKRLGRIFIVGNDWNGEAVKRLDIDMPPPPPHPPAGEVAGTSFEVGNRPTPRPPYGGYAGLPAIPAPWVTERMTNPYADVLETVERDSRGSFLFLPVTTAKRRPFAQAAYGIWDAQAARLLSERSSAPSLLYQRPGYSGDDRLFYDLLSYAPGLNTSPADLRAVLEAEARPGPASRPGAIDPGARALFTKARAADWQALTFPAEGKRPALTLTFNGAGRFAYDRTLTSGLRERVVCDGTTLWHLYPDLGLAARRAVSRFHRLDLGHLVPWALPQPEDLARGADLRLAGRRTVAVVPHGAGKLKGSDGKPLPHVEMHLVFADGWLSERRLVEMPAKKVLWRQTYAEGTVKEVAADGKEQVVLKGTLKAATAPALKPDLSKLVVLDLPYRSPAHVEKTHRIVDKPRERFTVEEARALLTAYVGKGDGGSALVIFRQGLARHDRHDIGWYVLLAAVGVNLDSDNGDVLGQHPDSPLAHYLALHSSPVLRKHASGWAAGSGVWGEGFLGRLAHAHALLQRWQSGRGLGGTPAQRSAERGRALAFVRRHAPAPLAWALLGLVQDRTREAERRKEDVRAAWRALADGYALFAEAPGLGTAARYEQARCLFRAGQAAEARKRFAALYASTLKAGGLLRLDADFRAALLGSGKEADGWGELMRTTAGRLVKEGRRAAVLTLAQQCWQLDDPALAGHLYAVALADLPEGESRLSLQLAALEFLWHTGQLARADVLLRELLAEPGNAGRAELWRLAAKLAEKRDMPARRLECLERALSAEQRDEPAVVNLAQVRADYQALLGHYGKLAEALVTLKLPAPAGFREKVVRAADRWRALDREASAACHLAAGVLRTLGERELAWDYLTTPAALKPNEAEPWAKVAEQLRRQGEPALAERAYRAACEAEPTDAQLLWERAGNLREAGRLAQARALYRQLAEGSWGPRFRGLVEQARWQLERR